MKKVLVFSNKFSPAHFSHLIAFYKSFKSLDYECVLVLDVGYKKFLDSYNEEITYKFNTEINKDDKADIIFIYNISSVDSKYIKLVKKENTKLFIVVHEPWNGAKNTIKNYLKKSEPLNETIKAFARNFYLKKLLKKNANVIVCSNNAFNIYNKHNSKKNSVNVFSLIFEDENEFRIDLNNKKYFSFIGSATPAHGFNEYIEFIKNNKEKDILFQIATSSSIKEILKDDDIQNMIQSNKLIVREGNYMSNEEINEAYKKSIATWMVYKRSTQSGVICKSWMFGTPVICSNIGSFSEYVDGRNGVILENINNEEILNKYMQINSDLDNMSKSSRESFDKNFNYKYKLELLKKIIEN